jgi:penicillin-binding protein 1A
MQSNRNFNNSSKKPRRRLKLSVVNKVTTVAVIFCSLILFSTGVLSYLTRDAIEPNKAKLEGKYGHMEIATINDIPQYLKDAVVAIEDKRFYSHKGVDLMGLIRATVKNTVTGTKEGGSTLEMQISKNLLTSQEQTYERKLQDIKIASQMNKCMTKDEILEVYLNSIYLGKGATGVKAGARIYFGKDISELNLAECAMLAGITKNPSKYTVYNAEEITLEDEVKNLKDALIFTTIENIESEETSEESNETVTFNKEVVQKLLDEGLITEIQYDEILNGTLKVEKAVLNQDAVDRQKTVLNAMKSQKYITKKEYEDAINTKIIIDLG